jgi:cytochrome c556
MRRFVTFVLTFALAGTALMAEKAKTAEDMDKAMKKVGTTQQSREQGDQRDGVCRREEAGRDPEDDADRRRELLGREQEGRRAAVQQGRAGEARRARQGAGGEDADQAKTTAAYRDAMTTCNSCHKVYRGVDANNQFVIKPGTI